MMRTSSKKLLWGVLLFLPFGLWLSRPMPIQTELIPLPLKSPEAAVITQVVSEVQPRNSSWIPADLHDPVGYAPPRLQKEADQKSPAKIEFTFDALKVREQDDVRLKGAKAAVNYHVDEKQSIALETSQQVYDRQDAKAWGQSAKDESAAGLKYKLKF